MYTNEHTMSYEIQDEGSDLLCQAQFSLMSHKEETSGDAHTVLSLFSGCGGMDLGFEGSFIAHRKSVPDDPSYVGHTISDQWVMLRKNAFTTVFANDILKEAEVAWTNYMTRFGHGAGMFHNISIVDLVKMHNGGTSLFPDKVDVVVGGFPCQDFSVAGKRKGFDSDKNDKGERRADDAPSEETRGKLYFWMKQVIDIVKPKVFIAENVKGLVNLGDVKDIIQRDFASAGGDGYIVLAPQVLRAWEYGVPESRERVIFIGIRRDALRPEALASLEAKDVPKAYDPYPHVTHSAHPERDGLLPLVTTGDVFAGLKEPEESRDASQQVYSKAKYLSNGSQGQAEIKPDGIGPTIRSEHHGNIEFRRLSAEHGGKHAEELAQGLAERRLTPRECALIQTFPPDYQFVMKSPSGRGYRLSASGAYKVIGNAVPPVLAFNIARRLEEIWPLYFE